MVMKIVGLDLSINSSGCVKFELDKNLDIVDMDYRGFTHVKKNSSKNVLFYSKKQFRNYFEQNDWMLENILSFCEDAQYVAVEDYAYGANGKVFHIAEFSGSVKSALYFGFGNNDLGVDLRLYDPCSIKMFACDNGTATKEDMIDKYDKYLHDPLKLNYLPRFKSPKEDIVDAFWIARLLQLELKLRKGLVSLKSLTEKQIQIFNRVTKAHPANILATDFYSKLVEEK